MNQAADDYQRAVYETPLTVSLGPHWSAITAGFAVMWLGQVYITPAGQRYLDSLSKEQETS